VAAPNLTRTAAEQRAALVTVTDYAIELDLTDGAGRPGTTTFTSTSTVRFDCARPGESTWIDLVAAGVTSAVLNGTPLDVSRYNEEDGIALPALAEHNELTVRADCRYMNTGEGLHRFVDPVDNEVYLYSQFETADAKRMFACFDQPDLKARYQLTVTAAGNWKVISNAVVESSTPAEHGARTHRFATSEIISTYLVALIAGPYESWHDEHDGIPLGIYCRSSLAGHMDSERLFTETKQGFDFYHANFGVRYPFGKYDQLFVPEFNAGAMENAGAVTFLEDYVFRSRVTKYLYERRAETVLHEMAHMWFGDLVTMRWWDDLWLNESFATWAGTLAQAEATRWTSAWTTFAQLYKAWAYRQDQLPSTHPIAADIPDIAAVEVNFDGITYAKGASVLKQLVAYVGRENFLDAVRKYFAAHAWGNATLADLLAALEETSGRDLTAWSEQWLQTAGVNTLRPSYTLDEDDRFTEFAVEQEAAASHPVLRPHRIAIGLYDLTADGLVRRQRVETDVAGPRTVVTELAGQPRPDLVLVNDDDLSYAKIRLDARSLRTLVESIGSFTDSLPAALCWSAAWDMCRDAEMAARDYVQLVMLGVSSVTDISVVQTLLRQASQAVRRFADPGWRETGLALMADGLRGLLHEAKPGSDAQLAYVRAFAGTATAPDDLALLAGLLDGSVVLDGLTVDTELRWALLGRLVSRCYRGFGTAEIDAELTRDATDSGERHEAACRAAIPAAEAKQDAWDLLVSGEQALATFRATLSGFADPDQPELVNPYREKYFAALADAWRTWSSAMAQDFVSGAYTVGAISEETVRATDEYIAATDPPAALRRLLLEGRDDVLRALRCQARDRQAP